jgi:hypothetical protein
MKRFLDWFKGQSKRKRALIVSPPILLLLAWGVIDSWHTRDTSVLSKGTVLAEGRLGVFKATGETFTRKPATARFVIEKIEVFEPGILSGFPPDCSTTDTSNSLADCSPTPDSWPIVVIWLRCSDFFPCVGALDAACPMEELQFVRRPKASIWWKMDSAGHKMQHPCVYNDQAETGGNDWVMGFVAKGSTAPKRFSLVVHGRDVPIRW